MVQTILETIKRGEIAPLYMIHGADEYIGQLVKQTLIEAIPEDERAMNVIVYHMLDSSLATIIEEADSMAFFGERKLIFVENPIFLTSDKQGASVDTTGLEEYVKAPNNNSTIVFHLGALTIDNRKKIVKTLKVKAIDVNAEPMNESAVTQFVQQSIHAAGYTIKRQDLQYLLEKTEYHLGRCMNELDKLYLATLDDRTITHHMIEELVPNSMESNVFALVEQLLKRQVDKTLLIYRELILQKEEPIKLLAIILGQFRLMLQISILQQKGYQQADIAKQLKQHPYRVKLAMPQSRQYALGDLAKAYQVLAETDYKLKTANTDKQLLMELTLLQLMTKESL